MLEKKFDVYEIGGDELEQKLTKIIKDNPKLVYVEGDVYEIIFSVDQEFNTLEIITVDRDNNEEVVSNIDELLSIIFNLNVVDHNYYQTENEEDVCRIYVK